MDGKRLREKIVPYRGLKPFESEHTELFFGRERIIKDIWEKLHQNNPLLIIGSSGSGKSSIIQAGLIPLLENDTWNVLPPIKPGTSLLGKLVKTFNDFFVGENNSKRLRKIVYSYVDGLCQLENYLPGTKNYLLIIDQFEEVFTLLPENELQHCIKLLTQILVQPPARLKILLAMRADFLGFCLQYSGLTQLVQTQTIYIPPLEESEWSQIIVEPAEYADYIIGTGLREEILKDVSQEANCLALLQFTLLKLWENTDPSKQVITHPAYKQMGGLFGALNYYIDLFFENLSSLEKTWTKKIFLKLLRPSTAKDTRQRQLKKRLLELGENNQNRQECIMKLIHKLLDEQLLVQEDEDGQIWIDLAHEVLIDRWNLFKDWQQETRKERQIVILLEDALLNWQKNAHIKNLATPELLKKIIDNQNNLEYFLDTTIKAFFQQSLEYYRFRHSVQLATTHSQGNDKQLIQAFVSGFTTTNLSSINFYQEKKDEITEILDKRETLDIQKGKRIIEEPQKNSEIINNIITVYGDYINIGNSTNYENSMIDGVVKRISITQEVNLNQVHQVVNREKELETKKSTLIDFAIITAIRTERLAILNAFEIDEKKDRIRRKSRTYWCKRFFLQDGSFYEIVVAQSLDIANVNAAIIVNDTLHYWKPGAILMVGIAAAAKPEPKQYLGDLVIAKEVYYYETGKITAEGKLPEPQQIPLDATLLDRVQALPDCDFSILVERPDGSNSRPKIEPGVIASGDKVIADAVERDAIASANRKIMAIEMEGYGVISAAWQSFDQVRCLVIRSLCDYADFNKHDRMALRKGKIIEAAGVQRSGGAGEKEEILGIAFRYLEIPLCPPAPLLPCPSAIPTPFTFQLNLVPFKHDQWHIYAAAVAAGFTKHFLLDEPLAPKNPPKR